MKTLVLHPWLLLVELDQLRENHASSFETENHVSLLEKATSLSFWTIFNLKLSLRRPDGTNGKFQKTSSDSFRRY